MLQVEGAGGPLDEDPDRVDPFAQKLDSTRSTSSEPHFGQQGFSASCTLIRASNWSSQLLHRNS
jgi:hypothetical protein